MSAPLSLTPQQARLLTFIRSQLSAGTCPTWAEMQVHIGSHSRSTVSRLVDALVARGHLLRGRPGAQRALALADKSGAYRVMLPAGVERRLLERSQALDIPPEALIVSALEHRYGGGRA